MQVRRVVTGHDAKGRAVIARDEQIAGVNTAYDKPARRKE